MLVGAKDTRCLEANALEVAKECVHGRSPRTGATPDGISNADGGVEIPAERYLILHSMRLRAAEFAR